MLPVFKKRNSQSGFGLSSKIGWALMLIPVLVSAWSVALFGLGIGQEQETQQRNQDQGKPARGVVKPAAKNQDVPAIGKRKKPKTPKILEPTEDNFENKVRPFLEAFCLDCHSGEGSEGDVDLDQFDSQAKVESNLEVWSHVLDAIEQNEMPPEDSSQPNDYNRSRIKNWILASIAKSNQSNPVALGRLRRLNRVEYENTIRDLFRLSRGCFSN